MRHSCLQATLGSKGLTLACPESACWRGKDRQSDTASVFTEHTAAGTGSESRKGPACISASSSLAQEKRLAVPHKWLKTISVVLFWLPSSHRRYPRIFIDSLIYLFMPYGTYSLPPLVTLTFIYPPPESSLLAHKTVPWTASVAWLTSQSSLSYLVQSLLLASQKFV